MKEQYKNKVTQALINDIQKEAKKFLDTGLVAPIKVIEYYKSLKGLRATFEKDYFTRRRELHVLAISLYLGLHNQEQTIELLEQTIWEICNEFAWGLPAHLQSVNGTVYTQENKTLIDLFASETGQSLAEIMSILGEHLSPLIKSRITDEIETRIFQSFLSKEWEWEHRHDNWSAVIGGSIGMAALDLLEKNTDKQKQILKKLELAFDSYLNGFAEDGACFEGAGYWAYGFGYYIYFAEKYRAVLHDDTYLTKPKAQVIANFPYNALISNKQFVPYSDSPNPTMPTGLLNFCSDYFKTDVPAYGQASDFHFSHCYRWANMYRNVIWTKEAKQMKPTNSHFFKNVAWLVIRNEETNFSFSAVAGENNSHHNHNDIGNFIIGNGQELILTDLGAGKYDKAYFLPIKRYESLNTRSLGHSVAFINNREQVNVEKPEYYHMHSDHDYTEFFAKHNPNANHKAENVLYTKDGVKHVFTMDLANAYPTEAKIKSYARTFNIDESKRVMYVVEKISFESEEQSDVSQGFVSFIKPEITNNCITWSQGNTKLQLDFDSSCDEATYVAKEADTHLKGKTTVFITRLHNKNKAALYERKYMFSLVNQ